VDSATSPDPGPDGIVRPATVAPHRRRPRYSGRNPRKFNEKYKEHDPLRFAADVAKVVASGKTPAGAHRSILVDEVLDHLELRPGETAVDATLGYGGHARAMLERLRPGGRLIGLDVDPIEQPKAIERLRLAGFGEDIFTPVRRNFAGLPQVLAELGLEGVDAVFADLGVSSMQLDDPARGFTFKDDGPLDLRLNPSRPPSAAQLLARLDAEALAALLAENSDEPYAGVIASEIVSARDKGPIDRTQALAGIIRATLQAHRLAKTRDDENTAIRRCFQALRIAVNDEFGALDTLLRHLPACLKPGGRAVILTFHSGEDRRVKKSFQAGLRSGTYSAAAEEVVRPSSDELRSNPRSASAKLRWAVRVS
jgi:16S rRNA (cytosine1402-N4)-methyltransferase